jgi:hypothetical protein
MKFKHWIALFSQTGSEIADLSSALNKTPDFVITNADFDQVDSRVNVDFRVNKEEAKTLDILENLDFNTDNTLIYNGHPGLITKYPELKGKDPQERAWDNLHKYDVVGSVVHQVVEEVDAGEIVAKEFLSSSSLLTLDDTYSALKQTSFRAWYRFLKEHLYNKV